MQPEPLRPPMGRERARSSGTHALPSTPPSEAPRTPTIQGQHFQFVPRTKGANFTPPPALHSSTPHLSFTCQAAQQTLNPLTFKDLTPAPTCLAYASTNARTARANAGRHTPRSDPHALHCRDNPLAGQSSALHVPTTGSFMLEAMRSARACSARAQPSHESNRRPSPHAYGGYASSSPQSTPTHASTTPIFPDAASALRESSGMASTVNTASPSPSRTFTTSPLRSGGSARIRDLMRTSAARPPPDRKRPRAAQASHPPTTSTERLHDLLADTPACPVGGVADSLQSVDELAALGVTGYMPSPIDEARQASMCSHVPVSPIADSDASLDALLDGFDGTSPLKSGPRQALASPRDASRATPGASCSSVRAASLASTQPAEVSVSAVQYVSSTGTLVRSPQPQPKISPNSHAGLVPASADDTLAQASGSLGPSWVSDRGSDAVRSAACDDVPVQQEKRTRLHAAPMSRGSPGRGTETLVTPRLSPSRGSVALSTDKAGSRFAKSGALPAAQPRHSTATRTQSVSPVPVLPETRDECNDDPTDVPPNDASKTSPQAVAPHFAATVAEGTSVTEADAAGDPAYDVHDQAPVAFAPSVPASNLSGTVASQRNADAEGVTPIADRSNAVASVQLPAEPMTLRPADPPAKRAQRATAGATPGSWLLSGDATDLARSMDRFLAEQDLPAVSSSAEPASAVAERDAHGASLARSVDGFLDRLYHTTKDTFQGVDVAQSFASTVASDHGADDGLARSSMKGATPGPTLRGSVCLASIAEHPASDQRSASVADHGAVDDDAARLGHAYAADSARTPAKRTTPRGVVVNDLLDPVTPQDTPHRFDAGALSVVLEDSAGPSCNAPASCGPAPPSFCDSPCITDYERPLSDHRLASNSRSQERTNQAQHASVSGCSQSRGERAPANAQGRASGAVDVSMQRWLRSPDALSRRDSPGASEGSTASAAQREASASPLIQLDSPCDVAEQRAAAFTVRPASQRSPVSSAQGALQSPPRDGANLRCSADSAAQIGTGGDAAPTNLPSLRTAVLRSEVSATSTWPRGAQPSALPRLSATSGKPVAAAAPPPPPAFVRGRLASPGQKPRTPPPASPPKTLCARTPLSSHSRGGTGSLGALSPSTSMMSDAGAPKSLPSMMSDAVAPKPSTSMMSDVSAFKSSPSMLSDAAAPKSPLSQVPSAIAQQRPLESEENAAQEASVSFAVSPGGRSPLSPRSLNSSSEPDAKAPSQHKVSPSGSKSPLARATSDSSVERTTRPSLEDWTTGIHQLASPDAAFGSDQILSPVVSSPLRHQVSLQPDAAPVTDAVPPARDDDRDSKQRSALPSPAHNAFERPPLAAPAITPTATFSPSRPSRTPIHLSPGRRSALSPLASAGSALVAMATPLRRVACEGVTPFRPTSALLSARRQGASGVPTSIHVTPLGSSIARSGIGNAGGATSVRQPHVQFTQPVLSSLHGALLIGTPFRRAGALDAEQPVASTPAMRPMPRQPITMMPTPAVTPAALYAMVAGDALGTAKEQQRGGAARQQQGEDDPWVVYTEASRWCGVAAMYTAYLVVFGALQLLGVALWLAWHGWQKLPRRALVGCIAGLLLFGYFVSRGTLNPAPVAPPMHECIVPSAPVPGAGTASVLPSPPNLTTALDPPSTVADPWTHVTEMRTAPEGLPRVISAQRDGIAHTAAPQAASSNSQQSGAPFTRREPVDVPLQDGLETGPATGESSDVPALELEPAASAALAPQLKAGNAQDTDTTSDVTDVADHDAAAGDKAQQEASGSAFSSGLRMDTTEEQETSVGMDVAAEFVDPMSDDVTLLSAEPRLASTAEHDTPSAADTMTAGEPAQAKVGQAATVADSATTSDAAGTVGRLNEVWSSEQSSPKGDTAGYDGRLRDTLQPEHDTRTEKVASGQGTDHSRYGQKQPDTATAALADTLPEPRNSALYTALTDLQQRAPSLLLWRCQQAVFSLCMLLVLDYVGWLVVALQKAADGFRTVVAGATGLFMWAHPVIQGFLEAAFTFSDSAIAPARVAIHHVLRRPVLEGDDE